jgi:hypothetical protein
MENIFIYEEDNGVDENYLKLISSNLKEWDGENDEKQFEYLQHLFVKVNG